jgi:hypothetical protein
LKKSNLLRPAAAPSSGTVSQKILPNIFYPRAHKNFSNKEGQNVLLGSPPEADGAAGLRFRLAGKNWGNLRGKIFTREPLQRIGKYGYIIL